MSELPKELVDQLLSLIDQLRSESADFYQSHEDTQQWYNRGYANGMVLGLTEIAGADVLAGRGTDEAELLQGHEVMAWGKAYRHGEEMGKKETYEITGAG